MRNIYSIVTIVLFTAALVYGDDGALRELKSADPAVVQHGIAELRAEGPDGLTELLNQYDAHPDTKLLPMIDAVAAQRDAVYSRLYWYTDLNQAEAAAKVGQRPILYLRLMGKLTDEYSCANSRFFRTVLYSNPDVSKLLREGFVLVWGSERPVPVVTIDYGDGRILKRTLTGNSIHYVLDVNGRVVDALPGLFDPVSFRRIVSAAGEATAYGYRANYLDQQEDLLLRGWKKDVLAAKPILIGFDARQAKVVSAADADAAMRQTFSKCRLELPLLTQLSPQFAEKLDQSIGAADDVVWQKVAALHADDAKLDAQSIALIRGQNPAYCTVERVLDRTVQQFQQTLAEDSVRNNYLLRRQILSWLKQASEPVALDDLNRRVYSELFLTPRSDPWLGLMPAATYTALTDDGRCTTTSAR